MERIEEQNKFIKNHIQLHSIPQNSSGMYLMGLGDLRRIIEEAVNAKLEEIKEFYEACSKQLTFGKYVDYCQGQEDAYENIIDEINEQLDSLTPNK